MKSRISPISGSTASAVETALIKARHACDRDLTYTDPVTLGDIRLDLLPALFMTICRRDVERLAANDLVVYLCSGLRRLFR